MKITEFKRVGRTNRIKIYIEGELYAVVMDETIAKNQLELFKDYSKEYIDEIIESGQNLLAVDTGIKLLTLFPKTEKEFAFYLSNKGFNSEAINFATTKLREYNFLNDELYVQNYIQSKKEKKGKKTIEYELKLKGIDTEIIEKYIDDLISNQKHEIEKIAQKFIRNKPHDTTLKAKLFRHLAGKGFDYHDISWVINKMLKAENDDWN